MRQTTGISAIGLTEKDLAVVSVAMNLLDLPEFHPEILDRNDHSGEIALINSDCKEGQEYLKSPNKEQIKIAFSISSLTQEGVRFLQRPVRTQDLINTLNTACKYLKNNNQNNAQTTQSRTIKTEIQTGPSNNTPLLLDLINKARKKKFLLKIECLPYNSLYVNGAEGKVFSRASLPEIHIIAKEINNLPVVKQLPQPEFEHETHGLTNYTITTIIWHTSMAGSNGKILPGHNLDTPIKLTSIPRFPREYMRKRPGYLKMSAMLVRNAMSINHLQGATGIEQPLIIDFYNLLCSLGLATAFKKPNSAAVYENMNFKRKSLFSKLADKLRITK